MVWPFPVWLWKHFKFWSKDVVRRVSIFIFYIMFWFLHILLIWWVNSYDNCNTASIKVSFMAWQYFLTLRMPQTDYHCGIYFKRGFLCEWACEYFNLKHQPVKSVWLSIFCFFFLSLFILLQFVKPVQSCQLGCPLSRTLSNKTALWWLQYQLTHLFMAVCMFTVSWELGNVH